MSLINLICPHCGGTFELDKDRALQPLLTCPYCGNRSLMQKNEESIRLRGIITGKTRVAGTPSPVLPQATDRSGERENLAVAAVAAVASEPSMLVREPAAVASEPSVIIREPAAAVSREPAVTATSKPTAMPVPATAVLAEPGTTPAPTASAPPSPKITQPTRSLEEIIAETQAMPQPTPVKEKPAKDIPLAVQVRPTDMTEKNQAASDSAETDRLCALAETAAKKHDLPLFNAYSRQAIDRQPEDPRMYALRAILTEEADGFARSTWTNPTWSLLTPMRKQALLAQHFYNLNTALKYSRMERQHELIRQIAWQLIRQALDFFTEQADLRCRQNLIFKKFKGRFKPTDLRSARLLLEALRLIDKQTCPLGWQELLNSVRNEIRQAPRRVARRMRHL